MIPNLHRDLSTRQPAGRPAGGPAASHVWLPLAWGVASAAAFGTAGWWLGTHDRGITDFAFWWRATRAVQAGSDPYTFGPNAPGWELPDYLFYPGPALVLAWPFAMLAWPVAFALWSALGFGALGWALGRTGRAALPVLLSAPALVALRTGQWAPWIAAAFLVPALGVVNTAKPSLGAAVFGAAPSRVALLSGGALTLASLWLVPGWPSGWLANLPRLTPHPAPITTWIAPLLLLAVLRWRQPEARLLFLYGCVPQLLLFADQLPLLLVARRRMHAALLWASSWLAALLWLESVPSWAHAYVQTAQPYVLTGVYVPALAVVLTRPNVGPVPAWFEAALARARVPGWLRGRPDAVVEASAAEDGRPGRP
jgi:hypothetical protein